VDFFEELNNCGGWGCFVSGSCFFGWEVEIGHPGIVDGGLGEGFGYYCGSGSGFSIDILYVVVGAVSRSF